MSGVLQGEHAAAVRQAHQCGGGARGRHGQPQPLPLQRRGHVQVLPGTSEDVRGQVRPGQ